MKHTLLWAMSTSLLSLVSGVAFGQKARIEPSSHSQHIAIDQKTAEPPVAKRYKHYDIGAYRRKLKAKGVSSFPETTQSIQSERAPRSANSAKPFETGQSGKPVLGITSARELKIKFLGYKELTGLYRVNADATVSIPVIGRISVSGLDAAHLEKILSRKVTDVTGRKAFATVEITAYKPVFVTGVVKTAKSYPWTSGMTVLHVVALAGGMRNASVAGLNVPLSTNSEVARIHRATDKLKRALARLARLRAERVGASNIKMPKRLVELVGEDEAKALLRSQRRLLLTNNKAFESRDKAVRQAIRTAEEELNSLTRQQDLIKRQIALRKKRYVRLKALARRGLVSTATVLARETEISVAQEKSMAALVARARLQGRLLDLQRELLLIKRKNEGVIDQKIAKQESAIAIAEIDLKAARRAVKTLNIEGGFSLGEHRQKQRIFQIVREVQGQALTLNATRSTRLWPGDIVIVK